MAKQARTKPGKVLVPRHGLAVRLTHWVNAIALFFLLGSGLQIFIAHPALYWGQASTFADPWISMKAVGDRGITTFGDWQIDTTGLFGLSENHGRMEARGLPAWMTFPPNRNLALGRTWHFFFAWVFVINGLIYLVTSLISRHLTRDLVPTRRDLSHIGQDIKDHLRLRFPKGEESRRYQVLQRLAYSAMVFVVLPLVVLSGMTMSPALNAAFPWLLDLFGGRQSGRTIHFLCALAIVLFVIVHLAMVLLAGPINQVRAMITGKLAIEPEPSAPTGEAKP